jgi:4-hydroxybenzoyl-CoA reductase subunit alpha
MDEGRILNPSIADYKLIRSLDMPETKILEIDTYEPEGPFGAKEAGEGLTNPTAGAIGNAVYKAVGVRINDLPITPEKVFRALREKEKENGEWRIANGEWRMANSEWRMANSEWRIANGVGNTSL